MSKQINISVDGGTIVLYGDEETQSAGMMFIPNDSNEEIDLIYAVCKDKNGKDGNHPSHGTMTDIDIHCYEDVWDENYTHKFKIDMNEAYKSITEPYQPDSAKS